MPNTENNKRIAKNTLLMYFRMFLTMIVSLYTVRVILNILGVIDYGIYSVVGGIVMMFSFLSISMANASQRYFSFDIGSNNIIKLKNTFSTTVIIYAIISLLIFILAETIGLWFLNNQLIIPKDRIVAANWIYQFSILTFIINILAIPYYAIIIAREKMSIYAYIGIFEALLKLATVYFLTFFSIDKLKLYAVLIFIVSCIVSYTYVTICTRKFEESRFRYYWDKELFKSILSYSSWMLMGSLTSLLSNHGLNILINIFFGPIINASRAIAYQVNSAIVLFSTNFYTTVRPQITKAYASKDNNYMINLVIQSSKFSFYLLLLLAMPILFETRFILNLWLKNSTDTMVIFTRLMIILSLITSLENPLSALVQATGNVKKYELLIGSITLLSLPLSYVFFKFGYAPQVSIYILIIVNVIVHFLRLWVIKDLVGMPMLKYIKEVLYNVILVSCTSAILPFVLILYFNMNSTFRFLVICISCFFSVIFFSYLIGLNKEEKRIALGFIKKYKKN